MFAVFRGIFAVLLGFDAEKAWRPYLEKRLQNKRLAIPVTISVKYLLILISFFAKAMA